MCGRCFLRTAEMVLRCIDFGVWKKSDQDQLPGFAQTSWKAGALLTCTGRLWGEQVWKHQSCEGPTERLVEIQAAMSKRKWDTGAGGLTGRPGRSCVSVVTAGRRFKPAGRVGPPGEGVYTDKDRAPLPRRHTQQPAREVTETAWRGQKAGRRATGAGEQGRRVCADGNDC